MATKALQWSAVTVGLAGFAATCRSRAPPARRSAPRCPTGPACRRAPSGPPTMPVSSARYSCSTCGQKTSRAASRKNAQSLFSSCAISAEIIFDVLLDFRRPADTRAGSRSRRASPPGGPGSSHCAPARAKPCSGADRSWDRRKPASAPEPSSRTGRKEIASHCRYYSKAAKDAMEDTTQLRKLTAHVKAAG